MCKLGLADNVCVCVRKNACGAQLAWINKSVVERLLFYPLVDVGPSYLDAPGRIPEVCLLCPQEHVSELFADMDQQATPAPMYTMHPVVMKGNHERWTTNMLQQKKKRKERAVKK